MFPDPIVIMGAPRSGTTYLRTMVNQHPDVFITHETRIFVWMHRTMVEGLSHPQRFLSHKAEFEAYLSTAMPDLIRAFYRDLASGALYWGDKNPHYASPGHAGTMPLIRDLFPRSRFIHVYRDGRDVVASLVRKRFPDGSKWVDFDQAHEVWNGHIEVGHTFGDEIESDRYLEIRYEDLLANDLAGARQIFEFLGIDLAPEVVDFCRRQMEERTPLSGPTSELGSSADQSDWETIFTPEERERSLVALSANLSRFGYLASPEVEGLSS